ncbi:MAG: flap endonuclease-1 [Candidatus Lokiarchaeota archaeon]|nr:flap endonuclease-1 [Candidatus Lokiarchaeota archaeon]
MGIKINELVKDVRKTISFENLLNKKISIDAFNSIYQFLAIIRQRDGTSLMDLEGNVTSHLSGLFYRNIKFLEYNIKPIYVFDGKPPELKLNTINERRKIKAAAKEKMIEAQESEDFKEARKFAQLTSKLDSNMIEESKLLLKHMGIPVVDAPSEGEAQSAYLVNRGDAWASASQDYDTLLFGSERFLRNFSVNRSKKVRDTTISLDIEYISLSKFLDNLGITREQLIDMGILIGTDFFPGIKGIGQHKAFDLIKKHESLENMLKNNVQVSGKQLNIDIELVNRVKEIFLRPKINPDYPKITWRKVDYDKLEELLVEKHNFSKNRVVSAIKKLRDLDSDKKQISLDSFFK